MPGKFLCDELLTVFPIVGWHVPRNSQLYSELAWKRRCIMSGNNQGGINIPGIILDELKNKDYSNDERFKSKGQNKKRNAVKQISRKDKRKQLRAEKKDTKIKSKKQHRSHRGTEEPKEEKKPVVKSILKKNTVTKENKSHEKASKSEESEDTKLPFSSDDELSSGDFDEFDEGDLDEEEWEQLRELEDEQEEGSAEDSNDDIQMTAEETMEKLRAIKHSKPNKMTKSVSFKLDNDSEENNHSPNASDKEMTVEETMNALKAKKALSLIHI